MGNCALRTDQLDPTLGTLHTGLTRSHFLFCHPIGRGGFSKVWKVRSRQTKEYFALKEMSKDRIIAKKSVASVMNELRVLAMLKQQFIVNMLFAFQDSANLYLVMNLMPGGDFRYYIGRMRRLSEVQTKFFVCCLVLALEYLHTSGVIHRDVKPENIVLDAMGYARLTDFGIAKLLTEDNSTDTSGTPGYMAPEVMCKMRHGVAVDYFALGVITYEFMLGRRPYAGRNRKDIRDAILAKQVTVEASDVPPGWNPAVADFITKLIQRKPNLRLGYQGYQEVKYHPWIRDVSWDILQAKTAPSPFNPVGSDNFDEKFTNEGWKDEDLIRSLQLNDSVKQELFTDEELQAMQSSDTEGIRIEVKASSDTKCERCWHYRDDVGHDATHPTLCGRCTSNLYGDGEVRHCA